MNVRLSFLTLIDNTNTLKPTENNKPRLVGVSAEGGEYRNYLFSWNKAISESKSEMTSWNSG